MPEKISEIIASNLQNLPENSGVYEMRTEDDETLYVGKAKNLKSRVKSYFLESANHSARIQKLVEKVHHLEWTQTSSEIEALLLETNLIKEKKPKFNILMRDDKNFSYIKVTMQEDFPRIFLTRRVLKDGAKYFGPKTSSSSVRKTIDLLQDIFQFRSSTIGIQEISEGNVEVSKLGSQKIPCLNFHLGKCDAPRVGQIPKAAYAEKISAALDFLKGNCTEILNSVQKKMNQLAQEGKFELAAKMRDKMLAIKSISEKQIISAPDEFSADIIGTYQNFGHLFFHLFSLRDGKIINSETFAVRLPENSPHPNPLPEGEGNRVTQEAVFSFLRSHPERVADSPKVIIMTPENFPLPEKNTWEEFFRTKFGHRTEISLPQKGKRKKLLALAQENAENYAKRHSASFLKNDDNAEEILETLQKKLHMTRLPRRMECYDISHFSGQKTVASMVVFEDGKAKNADYRSFNIKSLQPGGIDDFASLEEATSRRLAKLPKVFPENWSVEKLKTKKHFENIFQNMPLRGKISSEIFYDHSQKQKKCQKKIEASFYGFCIGETVQNKTVKNREFSALVQKNHLIKLGEVFLDTNSDTNILPQKFFLTHLFQKLRCAEYLVYTSEKKVQDFLESKGFTEISDTPFGKKFHGTYHSKKNDSFQKIPDVMVIDGGKGQLSSVAKSLMQSPYAEKIALCSIAKREEEIFLFNAHTAEIVLTTIQKNSPEGHLLQEIRDEAHRFAITKNRIGREKIAMKSVLDEIRGLGPKTKKILKQKGGVPAIREMSDDELLTIVSQKVLVQLREKL